MRVTLRMLEDQLILESREIGNNLSSSDALDEIVRLDCDQFCALIRRTMESVSCVGGVH